MSIYFPMTEGQKVFLKSIAEFNGIPLCKEDTKTASSNFLNTRAGRMRFSTLMREGLAWFEKGCTLDENTIGLTQSGFDVYERECK